jgi:hypothetical protein
MRWFDDLWLKEGFAQYMAYETLATLYPPNDEIWKRFYQSFKPAAYAIDATQGTTPIHQSIANLKCQIRLRRHRLLQNPRHSPPAFVRHRRDRFPRRRAPLSARARIRQCGMGAT